MSLGGGFWDTWDTGDAEDLFPLRKTKQASLSELAGMAFDADFSAVENTLTKLANGEIRKPKLHIEEYTVKKLLDAVERGTINLSLESRLDLAEGLLRMLEAEMREVIRQGRV